MAYTIKYNNPNYEAGGQLHLTGVGLIENGGEVKLDKDAEKRLEAVTGRSVKDYFKDNEMVTVSGTTELKSKGGEK